MAKKEQKKRKENTTFFLSFIHACIHCFILSLLLPPPPSQTVSSSISLSFFQSSSSSFLFFCSIHFHLCIGTNLQTGGITEEELGGPLGDSSRKGSMVLGKVGSWCLARGKTTKTEESPRGPGGGRESSHETLCRSAGQDRRMPRVSIA